MSSVSIAVRKADQTRLDCAQKLKSVRISEKYLPVLGFLLDLNWGNPRIMKLRISPQDQIFARFSGQLSFQLIFESSEKLVRDFERIARVSGLDLEELEYLVMKLDALRS